MPIFEYRCTDCGDAFEAFVTSERAPECPACHGAKLVKLLSSPGMVGSANGGAKPARTPGPAAGGCGMGTCGCRTNS